jgi:drug/metabolite transporter (DMT)-like permease
MSTAPVDLGGWSVPPIVPLVLVACLSTAFVYVAGFTAVSVLGARLTSFVALAEPVAALGVAWLLLGESPRPSQLAGCALIVAGVILIRADGSGRLRRGLKADADRAPFLPDPG